ncbi:hypothetical protein PPL_01267 [Heterostelium album PN500]|uniref:Peptidase M66 domain-containing protein n=1 Tax=Heterostelium pallidum (strain ATCC 26659 / Pp 5 / PN500) TaxID=670386 RepID=D3AYK7_HETP5|nr:hypothetical protein PPL_01267 [Heterostelium album PN500]EFA86034.1 hypothetical protein PPL_01267 [Heterostelium album PN500]|eukprot:XP_020438140.1 hypothetical protein PPL_01267 [Heterostelium album PN500]
MKIYYLDENILFRVSLEKYFSIVLVDSKQYEISSDKVKSVKFAQTHVLPASGLSWSNFTFNLVPNRDTLLLVQFETTPTSSANDITIMVDNATVATLTLNTPDKIPSNFANYPATSYCVDCYSVMIPRNHVKQGMEIIVSSDTTTGRVKPTIIMDTNLIFKSFPFYLFGANPTNTLTCIPKTPAKDSQDLIFNTWPLSSVEFKEAPGFTWDRLVCPPIENKTEAMVVSSKDDISNNDLDNVIAEIINEYRKTNGELKLNVMYDVPMLPLNSLGSVDLIDRIYVSNKLYISGNFQSRSNYLNGLGFAFGIQSFGAMFKAGKYPYPNGSYNGSSWGFNSQINKFISPYVIPNDDNYDSCLTNPDYLHSNDICFKKDYISNVLNDMYYPDYISGMIQSGVNKMVQYDKTNKKFMSWDATLMKSVEIKPNDTNGGFLYLDDGLPMLVDVDVYTIVMVHNTAANSKCGGACSNIYPIIKSRGNLMRHIDPSDEDQRDLVEEPSLRDLYAFCAESGCDFSLRATYADGSIFLKLLQKGMRDFDNPRGPIHQDYLNPLNPKSVTYFVENIPADKVLTKVELLSTPYGYKKYTANPPVLLSKIIS